MGGRREALRDSATSSVRRSAIELEDAVEERAVFFGQRRPARALGQSGRTRRRRRRHHRVDAALARGLRDRRVAQRPLERSLQVLVARRRRGRGQAVALGGDHQLGVLGRRRRLLGQREQRLHLPEQLLHRERDGEVAVGGRSRGAKRCSASASGVASEEIRMIGSAWAFLSLRSRPQSVKPERSGNSARNSTSAGRRSLMSRCASPASAAMALAKPASCSTAATERAKVLSASTIENAVGIHEDREASDARGARL